MANPLVNPEQEIPPVNGPLDMAQPSYNVDPVSTYQEPFSVDTDTSAPTIISPEVAERRSFKFKYGLDEVLKKTKEELFDDISKGNEGTLREIAASELDKRKSEVVPKVIAELEAKKGSKLSGSEIYGVADIIKNLTAQTNPDSVLEEAYGKQFVATLDREAMSNPDSFLNKAKQKYPEEVAEIFNEKATLVTKREYLQTLHENIEDERKNQGWIPWGVDQTKFMLPGYEDVQMRGNVKGTGVFTGGGLGQNLEAQRTKLLNLPFDDMKEEVKRIVEPMRKSNPTLAAEWVKSMIELSTDDVFLKTAVFPVSLYGTGVGKGALTIARGAVKTTADKQLLKDTVKAAEDIAKASADPQVSKSTIEAAAGNLQESAITRATTNAVADMSGKPRATERAIESLSGTFRVDDAEMAAGPGRFGQDIVNRIEESSNTVQTNMFKAIENMQKVDRLPDVMATENGVRAVIESVKDRYTGLKNIIIDTSRPYKEKISNTWLVDMHLGQADGTYFSTREVAENYKKFLGLKDGEFLEGVDKTRTPDVKFTKQLEGYIAEAEAKIADIEKRMANNTYSRPDKMKKDAETLEFLKNEALPNYKEELGNLTAKQTATVEQQGLGFYIKVTRPVNETSPIIRQLIAQTENTQIPNSPVQRFLNSLLGKSRTPEDVLSLAERQNRLAVTYAPSELFKILVENSPTLQRISSAAPARFSKKRKKWDEFVKVLENAQELPDALDATKKGYFFKSPSEMETYYQQWVHRLPDEDEIVAYFEFKRGMEIDRVFRNIAEHRNQQRVGAETVKVFSKDAEGNRIASQEFSGVLKTKLPGASDSIVVMGKHGEEHALDLSKMSLSDKQKWNEAITKGEYKLVEVYNPELRVLNGYGNIKDLRVRFILAKDLETRELDWNHIPRRGGGHIEYDYNFYLKQAKISYDKVGDRHWYEGDTTLMAVQLQKVGQDAAKHLNEVRKYLKGKNDAKAEEYSNQNLHIPWETVKGWFTPGKTADGAYRGAQLSVDNEIHLVKRGEKLINVDKSLERMYKKPDSLETSLRDGTKEGSLARQAQVEYSQERDAWEMLALEDKGTRGNPLYSISPAKVVDPVTTMNRGLSRIVKSNYMDDYKTMAVEHWLKQASNLMDAKDSEIRHSPMYYFREGKWKSNADKNATARLDAAKFHIEQLVGQPSDLDAQLHSYAQKLSDYMYEKAGPKGAVLTQEWLLPTIKDPFAFMRAVTFNAKLGLFNIPQFIVQAGNYSNILGIAGYKYASPGTLGAQLHFWSSVNSNPAIIKHLDDLASKFNLPGTAKWKPGEFSEAFHELNKTGFGNPGGEYAALDNPMNQKLISDSQGRTFLDWGQFFFKQGERNSRYGAWYTAFKEFRDINPLGRITDEQRAAILQRADLLNINMSRASSSKLHTGVLSIPTQFYTYQIRLMELMLSNRLTPKEKFSMFATNSLLYGLPIGVGLTGVPFSDFVRKKAMSGEYGEPYVVGDGFFSSVAMEGVVSALGAIATGKGDPSAGTWFDVGSRFGTKGFEFLGGLNRTDKGFLDIVGGPAYGLIKGTIEQSDGFLRAMISMAKGDQEVFPVVTEDLIDVFKEISSVNTAWRTIAAVNTGRWISKKDAYLADSSGAHAVFSAVTGLKDTRINDIQTMTNSLKDQKNYEQEVESRFRQEFRRGVLAQKDDNPQLAQKFFTRASAWLAIGGYPEDRYNNLVSKAINDNESVLSKVNFDFYIKKAPDALKRDRMGAARKSMLIQDKQNGE